MAQTPQIRSIVPLAMFVLAVLACSSGSPELRPGFFESPLTIENHGRIVEKEYRLSSGPGTEGSINYKILEVSGSPVRIPGGFITQTAYCEVPYKNAVALQVRGDSAGIYILQIDGQKLIYERLCDYSGYLGSWEGTKFKQCETEWDAENLTRVPSCGVPKNTYLIPATLKSQWLNIEYDNRNCPPINGNECNQEFTFPESGFICTSSPRQQRWFMKEFFLVDANGNRTPLEPEGNILQEGTLSKDEAAPETGKGRCKVSLSQFFYGKKADLKPVNPIFQNEDFLNNYHPECSY